MRFMWAEGIRGLLIGAFLGGLSGLGVCIWLIQSPLLFPGDTMLFGAILCGLLGFLKGEAFFDWLKENWYWFIGKRDRDSWLSMIVA